MICMHFKWAVCGGCGPMILCPACGNNCCNGGSGTTADGKECPTCSLAYEYQELALKHKDVPPEIAAEWERVKLLPPNPDYPPSSLDDLRDLLTKPTTPQSEGAK